jgi:hypothetical protein
LPDGLFSNQKIPIWVNFGVSWYKKYWYFYDHLEYFTAIWYILWQFGVVCGTLVYFSRFGLFGPIKIWQPCPGWRMVPGSDLGEKAFIGSRSVLSCRHRKWTLR